MLAAVLEDRAIFPKTVELASQLRSAFKIKSGDSLCDDPFSGHIRCSCSALQLNLGFHLCQSVQRRIQKSFKVKYRTDKDFALASRLVIFLAFVPPDHTETAFEALSIHSDWCAVVVSDQGDFLIGCHP